MVGVEHLTKKYRAKGGILSALDGISLTVEPGTLTVIKGPSGSGKSTLLLALGGMLRPSSGTVRVDGRDVYGLSPGARATLRAQEIGFVFQMFHLVPYLNVFQNVCAGVHDGAAGKARAGALLDALGMAPRRYHRPGQLSAGEKQRTAVARALVNDPKVILADEPTGNLDPDNAGVVIGALRDARDKGKAVIMVTHGNDADAYADTMVRIEQGKLVSAL